MCRLLLYIISYTFYPSVCLFFYKGCNLPCFFYVRYRKDAVWIRDKHLNFIKTGEWGKDAVYYLYIILYSFPLSPLIYQ